MPLLRVCFLFVVDFGEFDFIIIGAGTAGSTLAYELTKNVTWKVLLLEAGDKETDFSLIPSFAGFLKNSKFNWGYYTSPQKNSCKGLE